MPELLLTCPKWRNGDWNIDLRMKIITEVVVSVQKTVKVVKNV
jgi:hypothetical protein